MTSRARKIVFPIESLFPGGAEHALLRLASSLDRELWTPEVWLLRGSGELSTDFAERGIVVRDCSRWDWNPLTAVVKTTAIRSALRLAQNRVQVVHSFAWDGCPAEAAAATLAATGGYVVRIATATPKGNAATWALKLHLADRVVVLSEFSKRQILARYPWVGPKLRVVPNGVDCEQFAPSHEARQAVRRALGIPPGDIAMVCVARLFADKNHPFLLRAFRKLLSAGSGSPRLLLVGDGGQRQRLVELATELGIGHRVQFLGYRRDVARVLSACDLFVLASKAPDDGGIEGMSNAALEAMAAGLPVVMTKNGSEEILTSGQEGFLVDARDEAELVAALAALCQSGELRQAMGKAVRDRVKSRYNLATTVAMNYAIYRELLDQGFGRVPFARLYRALWQRRSAACSQDYLSSTQYPSS